ncbi:MAG: RNA polymerase factor sigma-32 [Deltaproteobacteria bacterium]|nr:RNA polymerase factor sigma-32 [Deltaproteobacteria bacterium]
MVDKGPENIEDNEQESKAGDILNDDFQPPMVKPTAEAPAEYDPLRRYLYEVGKYGLLTREEELELAIKVREHHDQEAALKLVTSNLRLVIKIAMDFNRSWTRNLLDLIQEGNVGLMQAVSKFDPYRGVKFSYYSSFWIKAHILKFILDNFHLVRVGTTQAQRKLFFNLNKERERLQSQGFEPSHKLLAENLQVSEADVIEMDQRLKGREVSLDASIRDNEGETHLSFLPAGNQDVDEVLAERQIKELLHQKLVEFRRTLNERDLDILEERILAEKPLTLQEMGEKHAISRERVRQLEVRIKRNIANYLMEEIPDFSKGDFLAAIGVED